MRSYVNKNTDYISVVSQLSVFSVAMGTWADALEVEAQVNGELVEQVPKMLSNSSFNYSMHHFF